MEGKPSRWRIRISTLFLLVIIAALASALVVSHWRRELELQRAMVMAEMLRREADMAQRAAVASAAKTPKGSAPVKAIAPGQRAGSESPNGATDP